MSKIGTKYGTFSFKELATQRPRLSDPYGQQAIDFCHQWLSGTSSFELQTSGSTGIPKSISVTKDQMIASAIATCDFFKLSDQASLLCLINTKFIGGKMMLVRSMVRGIPIHVIEPTSTPFSSIPKDISWQFTALVPLQLESMFAASEKETVALLNPMKAVIIGGSSLSNALLSKIQTLQVPVYSTYGMTETISHIALKKLNGVDAQACYTALPNIELKTDHRNCLQIKGAVTNQEWVQTNDIVELKSENQFEWIGRFDSIINSGGIKISPELLEEKLSAYLATLGINSYCIVGLPHPVFGEAVTLFYESAVDITMLFQFSLLEKYEIPKVCIRMNPLPLTASGKINRQALKKWDVSF